MKKKVFYVCTASQGGYYLVLRGLFGVAGTVKYFKKFRPAQDVANKLNEVMK